MLKAIQQKMKYFDWWIALIILSLMAFGGVMVFSASAGMAGSPTTYLMKQVIFYALAIAIILVIYQLNSKWIRMLGIVSYIAMMISFILMLVAFFFPPINGAKGWITLGSISIQPVEFYKVSLILWFTFALTRGNRTASNNLKKHWIAFFIIYATGTGILALYPDNGGIIITMGIVVMMVLSSGVRSIWAVSTMALSLGIWQLGVRAIEPVIAQSNNYGLQRFLAYLNPWKYAQTTGNQLINSYYAISNGGLFGRGIGNSIQKSGNLPEPNTDFIMAVVSEELGAISVGLIIVALLVVIWRMVYYAFQTNYLRYRLLLIGVSAYLFFQIIVNLGGVGGALPITGVTFPLISVGGSSILSLGIALGIALNVIAHIKKETEFKNRERS
ncbi:FtsW/RodA/SpoVE family cell cycle protein [Weissella diestrammenae]|uniref:Probable peptidoglycan glycosyltransferase FtsW n=1 Tax=Weissella diestrammenae TaxID=1162633 RepID=A0A7G9T5E7_9LACO|nr:FtsW/RodA/SpoVE family cell cycle protein [Weissella diestrammenae]MCM0583181.1 FtsW/RodA/SpoVE family cell cycle protein [Weissella diestrammenae]QNN75322.1 FtsW/RodA/SpoVE family cell cycle protein [Weissella diestrammenae]